jgi:hypothetical protein
MYSHRVLQATDERVQLLRDPLRYHQDQEGESLLITGTAPTSNPGLVAEITNLL